MSNFTLLTDLKTDHCPKVNFLSERCVRRRLTRSVCATCLNACPAEALSLIDNQMSHDAQICTGCMLCSASCPNDAFEVKGYNLEARIQSLNSGKNLIISCFRETQIHPEELVVPCVGGLSIIHLLAICMKRTRKIVFNISACQSCENKASAHHFESQLASLKKNHHGLIEAELITLKKRTDIISHQVTEHRRSFLKGMKKNLFSAVESQLPTFHIAPSDSKNPNRRIPEKVKLTKDLLKQLEQEKKDFAASLCLNKVHVSDKCKVCPLCKGICPTGAIRVENVDEEKALVIDNTLCSGCGLCITFCKYDALRLQRPEVLDKQKKGATC